MQDWADRLAKKMKLLVQLAMQSQSPERQRPGTVLNPKAIAACWKRNAGASNIVNYCG